MSTRLHRRSFGTRLFLDHPRREQLGQDGSQNRGDNYQHQYRVEYFLAQQRLTRGVERFVANQRSSQRRGHLRQRECPHGQPGLTRVAKCATSNRSCNSLSQDQRKNHARDEPEMAEDSLCYGSGDDQKAHHNEEDRNEEGPAEEIEFFFCRVVTNSSIDRQSGKKGSDDIRQVDEIRYHAGDRHYAKYRDKITRLVVVKPVQDPGAGPAYSNEDDRHKDRDLGDLYRESVWRKSGRVN